jgi:large subunit ribosomal protein L24
MMHIKKNDKVKILSGKDKGKESTVIQVFPKTGKLVVKDVAVITRHAKARKQGEVSGIKQEESAIELSNVMPLCKACKKPSRVNVKILENNKKARICNRCEEIF